MSKLVQFNTESLRRLAARHYEEKLENFSFPRSEGASASEIACGCVRKVVMDQMTPKEHDAKQLRIFRRGHLFEMDMADRLGAMGYQEVSPEEFDDAPVPCFCREMVVEHPSHPIGAHIDFVVKHKNGSLSVIECKTTGEIPEEPYPSWIVQCNVEVNLLALAYPDTPVSGSVLAANLNTGEEVEYPGIKPDAQVLAALVQEGLRIIRAKAEAGFLGRLDQEASPLMYCDKCLHRGDCPVFIGNAKALPPEVAAKAARYEELNIQKKVAEKRLAALKEELVGFTGQRNFKGTAEGLVLCTTMVNGRKSIDQKALAAKYPEVAADESIFKIGDSYAKIEVKAVPVTVEIGQQSAA